jgi:hypothetical protein
MTPESPREQIFYSEGCEPIAISLDIYPVLVASYLPYHFAHQRKWGARHCARANRKQHDLDRACELK